MSVSDDLRHAIQDAAASREWLTTLESVCSRETANSALKKFFQLAQTNIDSRLQASHVPEQPWQADVYMKTDGMKRPD